MDSISFHSLNPPLAAYVATILKGEHSNFVVSTSNSKQAVAILPDGKEVVGNFKLAKFILSGTQYDQANDEEIEKFATGSFNASLQEFDRIAQELNYRLQDRTYILGNSLSLLDLCIYEGIKNNKVTQGYFARFGKGRMTHLLRYIDFLANTQEIKDSDFILSQTVKKKVSSDEIKVMNSTSQYKLNIDLPGAQYGKVVTRFPPEASGILHIGHGKALCINRFLADMWGGKMIFRFDDTNPAKEREEYELGIIEDVNRLNIKYEQFTHTSDYFDDLIKYAEQMISEGTAYVDDTPKEEFKRRKQNGIESDCRENSVDKNFSMWEEMKKGTEYGVTCCLRAKFDMKSTQKTLWDPVMYRCVPKPHARHGDKYKIYPTYDFACPIVDSIEGVTHALRTSEYNDRDIQYYSFLDALRLRKPVIRSYSRISFYHTVMSKRKLQLLVDSGIVDGWEDPRFPTIRALLRNGLTLNGFFKFVVSQSSSVNVATLEWDALWSVNKKIIDPIAPRYTAINKEELVEVNVEGITPTTRQVQKHPQNDAVGFRTIEYTPSIYLSLEDVKQLKDNEEITLRNWGNIIIKEIKRNEFGIPIHVNAVFHPLGLPKNTTWRLTWLPKIDGLSNVQLTEYDYLFKEKSPDLSRILEVYNKDSKIVTQAVGDRDLNDLKKFDIIQLERIGFFTVDVPFDPAHPEQPIQLIKVPEGGGAVQKKK